MKTHFLKVLNMRFGLRTLHFYLKGSLQVRDAIVSAVRNSGVTVVSVEDRTPVAQHSQHHLLRDKRSIEVAMRKRPTSKEKMDKLINSVMQRLDQPFLCIS